MIMGGANLRWRSRTGNLLSIDRYIYLSGGTK